MTPNTSHFTTASQQTYMIGTFIALTYNIRKPRQREVKYFVPGHSSQKAAKQEMPSQQSPRHVALSPLFSTAELSKENEKPAIYVVLVATLKGQ